jgi:transposase
MPPEAHAMTQITARLPDSLVEAVDRAAARLRRSRAQLVRQAIEYYLEDLEDLRLGLERLQDPSDPVLDWADVRRELLDQD